MEGSSTHLRCSVYIDLCALERNLRKLKDFSKHIDRYIALVSADAFGYGLEASAIRLMLSGADAFAVSNIAEAIKLRQVAYGWKIIVLSSSLIGEEFAYIKHNITPVITTMNELLRFERYAKELDKKIDVHIRLSTQSLSIPTQEASIAIIEYALTSQNLNLEAFSLMGTGSGVPVEGYKLSDGIVDYIENKEIFNAKNGLIYIHHSDIVNLDNLPKNIPQVLRAGLVLFGMKADENSILKGFEAENVLKFRSSITLIKELPKGAYIGYSKTYTLNKTSRVGIISVGYGDGLARGAGSKSFVIVKGKKAPIIGIVSMDQAAIDLSDVPQAQAGDEVIIIGSSQGEEITIEEYSKQNNITPAQALTSITKRVARFYKTLY